MPPKLTDSRLPEECGRRHSNGQSRCKDHIAAGVLHEVCLRWQALRERLQTSNIETVAVVLAPKMLSAA
jgi:hypothetical protein